MESDILTAYCNTVLAYDSANVVAMDLSHAMLIASVVISSKPRRVCEIGIGSGQLSRLLLWALKYNQCGELVIVDNFADWNGVPPSHAQNLETAGAQIVCASERDFLVSQPAHAFDVLVSDADHYNAHLNADQYFRIVRPGGIVFLHDSSNPSFPNLRQIIRSVEQCGMPYVEFNAKSRDDERTDRGLCFVVNRGKRPYRVDLRSRLFGLLRTLKYRMFK